MLRWVAEDPRAGDREETSSHSEFAMRPVNFRQTSITKEVCLLYQPGLPLREVLDRRSSSGQVTSLGLM